MALSQAVKTSDRLLCQQVYPLTFQDNDAHVHSGFSESRKFALLRYTYQDCFTSRSSMSNGEVIKYERREVPTCLYLTRSAITTDVPLVPPQLPHRSPAPSVPHSQITFRLHNPGQRPYSSPEKSPT